MSEQNHCGRCNSGPVHQFEDASQCANCGAYWDNHHTYQPQPNTPIKLGTIPHSSGLTGSIGLQLFKVGHVLPDINLTH